MQPAKEISLKKNDEETHGTAANEKSPYYHFIYTEVLLAYN